MAAVALVCIALLSFDVLPTGLEIALSGALLGWGGTELVINFFKLKRRRLVEQRLANHCCVVCGYDLRGTPKQCPECGTKPKSKSRRQWLG